MLPAFPKAVLGLPINFHFADGPGKGNAASPLDPKDVQLDPVIPTSEGKSEKADRMASPVITRPVWWQGEWRPAIVILDNNFAEGLQVRVEGKNAAIRGDLAVDIPANKVANVKFGRLAPMRGQSNAIDALVEYLTHVLPENQRFQKVTQ